MEIDIVVGEQVIKCPNCDEPMAEIITKTLKVSYYACNNCGYKEG